MGDLHQVVIDDVGKVIGRQFVGTLVEDLVVEDGGIDFHLTTDEVIHDDILARFDEEANDVGLAGSDELLGLVETQAQRITHLTTGRGIVLEVGSSLACSLKLLLVIKSIVGLAGIEKHLHIFLIDLATLRLTIGAMIATKGDTFVKLYAEPLERLKDVFLGTRNEALAIGIFNTEQEFAAMLTGKEIVIKTGADAADVKRARRRWRKAYNNWT